MNSRTSWSVDASNRSSAVCADMTPLRVGTIRNRATAIVMVVRMSDRELQPEHVAPERRLPGQRPLRRVLDRFVDPVRLHLDPPIEVPVDAQRERTIAVTENVFRARPGRWL